MAAVVSQGLESGDVQEVERKGPLEGGTEAGESGLTYSAGVPVESSAEN